MLFNPLFEDGHDPIGLQWLGTSYDLDVVRNVPIGLHLLEVLLLRVVPF